MFGRILARMRPVSILLALGLALPCESNAYASADRDGDRIADERDKCPDEPETYNGFEDDDGCPDVGSVDVNHCGGGPLDNVYFRSGSAALGRPTAPILDALAATLLANPQLSLVELAGFVDRNERDPVRLAQERANAVLRALVKRGVLRTRLRARAHGAPPARDPQKPELDRRVELHLVAP